MGKGKSPTSEELEFVYRLFTKGAHDSDVLEEYKKLSNHGKLGYIQFREDVLFIRQRRKEFEVARRILEKGFRVRGDPVLAQRRLIILQAITKTDRASSPARRIMGGYPIMGAPSLYCPQH